jgi:electron transport complex protein RnfG
MLREAITRNSLLLAGFAVLTALLVAGTFLGTRERIAARRSAPRRKKPCCRSCRGSCTTTHAR